MEELSLISRQEPGIAVIDNSEESKQTLRQKLFQLLTIDCQKLNWEALEPFTNDLLNTILDGFTLYRYSPADYYNIRNFETGKLKFSDNGSLNDIYEGLPVLDISEKDATKLQTLKDSAYIKCFSESYDSNTMWAHYADNHRGICIAYDLSLLDCSDEVLRHIFPVIYSENRPLSDIHLLDICNSQEWLNYDIFHNAYPDESTVLNDALLLFLFKGTEWSSEREWRIMYSKQQLYAKSESNFIDRFIAFDCATEIYLGQRITEEIKKNIFEIVARINDMRKNTYKPYIRIFSMEADNKTYHLHKRELKQ